jgi:hypothetical protein
MLNITSRGAFARLTTSACSSFRGAGTPGGGGVEVEVFARGLFAAAAVIRMSPIPIQRGTIARLDVVLVVSYLDGLTRICSTTANSTGY